MACAGVAERVGAGGQGVPSAPMQVQQRRLCLAPATSSPTSKSCNDSRSLSFCTPNHHLVFSVVMRQQDGSEAPEFPRIIGWLIPNLQAASIVAQRPLACSSCAGMHSSVSGPRLDARSVPRRDASRGLWVKRKRGLLVKRLTGRTADWAHEHFLH
jgi:hypothetical protein